ncbi:DUF309 domain-containing protein [Cytobacillus spongiae]|jgi:predicted metal-dependent hydrolase|uniref:DUF309 domain-containing protein n=1 Tax=Cytobacillus spongiae TaxID=2901381 RepID=UPI001F2BF151|nr:DUF309 domain-containing protein [Cytobacillus spongiae]UII54699.1 DUF309 domain-containing protein [Cytobacillus spongiae]
MYPREYIQFLAHFHGDRDYFECHEILEEYWKSVDPRNKQSLWVGLIQFAVGNYHFRRNNLKGAYRTLKKAYDILRPQKHELEKLGIDSDALLSIINEQMTAIHSNSAYKSVSIPLREEGLVHQCATYCMENSMAWGAESDILNEHIIHRHMLRDRSNVISERINAMQDKNKKDRD